MDAAQLEQIKLFISNCKSDPSILSDPSLSFFRDYLESLPSSSCKSESQSKPEEFKEPEEEEEEEEEDEIIESDVEFEGETVEPDNDPPQKMGDSSVKVSEENAKASEEPKAKGMKAISEGKLEEAIEHLTEGILLNPKSSIMYAIRASVYIKMKKPNAAIRDTDAAFQLRPSFLKATKLRGIALSMVGKWEKAREELLKASFIDYDEEINNILIKVELNIQKLQEHREKYKKLRKERDLKRRKAAYEKAKKEGKVYDDPEIMEAFEDPEFMAAVLDVIKNPASLRKYQANPNVASHIADMMIIVGGPKWPE